MYNNWVFEFFDNNGYIYIYIKTWVFEFFLLLIITVIHFDTLFDTRRGLGAIF